MMTSLRPAFVAPALFVAFSAGAALASGPAAPVYEPPMTVSAPIATYDWGGAYVGLNIAAPMGDNAWSERGVPVTANAGDWGGTAVGISFGYDVQQGPMVYGAALDYMGTSLTADGSTGGGFNCAGGTCQTEVSNVYNLRGRIGRAFDRTLVYATGGFASGSATGMTTVENGSDRLNGWVAGLGVEHAVSNSFSLSLEYLYTDLGRLELPTACATNCYTDVSYGQVRLGANFRF